ncbi:MAG: type II secretion system F family protein [Pseudomonadales bacterium]
MKNFEYTAFDAGGKQKKGRISSDSERLARRELRDEGFFVTEISVPANTTLGKALVRRRVRRFDLAMLVRQLATLLHSGMALNECLTLMADQASTSRDQRLLSSWRSALMEGQSMAQAMAGGFYTVPESVIAAVTAAEESGHLDSVLERLADELEEGMANRQALTKAMVYPLVLLFVAVSVMSILLTVVVPQIASVFNTLDQALPTLTIVVVAISDFLVKYGIYLLLVLLGLVAGLVLLLQDPGRRLTWHKLLLATPVLGNWLIMGNLADWCRNMGLLLASGVPAVPATQIANTTIGNLALRAAMERVSTGVFQGASLAHALQREAFIPAFMLHMVRSGEASSELDQMLIRVANFYSTRLQQSSSTFLKLLEPALIILMGGMVVLIIGAVLLPIVQMNQLI